MFDTIIVSGGNISKEFALDFLRENEEKCGDHRQVLIAADRGFEFFLAAGMLPNLAVGDFDSLSPEGREALERAEGTEIIRLKPEKDDSDTQSALNFAISRGAKRIAILGATGSRMDHMLANMGLFLLAKERKAQIAIVDEHNYMELIASGSILDRDSQFGNYVSFFPIGGIVQGLVLEGFKYALNGYDLRTADSGLTVSNEIKEKQALVTYQSGDLLMIMSRD